MDSLTNTKQRLFIYDRREVITLALISALIALFTFTLGIHLGKKVRTVANLQRSADPAPLVTVPDEIPQGPELNDRDHKTEESLTRAIEEEGREEVKKTGITLETKRQVELPENLKSEHEEGAAKPQKPAQTARPPVQESHHHSHQSVSPE
jgi:hypothetical protein